MDEGFENVRRIVVELELLDSQDEILVSSQVQVFSELTILYKSNHPHSHILHPK